MSASAASKLSLDMPASYRVTFQGLLDQTWSHELGSSMQIEHSRCSDHAITTITGEVVDQAALIGMVNLIYDLGYPLISVTYLGEAS